MKNLLGILGVAAVVILGFLALIYGSAMFGVAAEGEVKEARVEDRYEAHEGSQAKIEGVIQTLENTRKEYIGAKSEAMRGALRQDAINAANRVDDAEIRRKSEGLYEWLQKIREERYNPNEDLETSTGG